MTAAARPVIIAKMETGKEGGYKTRQAAERLAGTFGDLDDATAIVERTDGVYRVYIVTRVVPPTGGEEFAAMHERDYAAAVRRLAAGDPRYSVEG